MRGVTTYDIYIFDSMQGSTGFYFEKLFREVLLCVVLKPNYACDYA